MKFFSHLWHRVSGKEMRDLRKFRNRALKRARAQMFGGGGGGVGGGKSIDAARQSSGGGWVGTPSNRDEDAANKEYLYALADVLQRAQNLDVNNPDLRGFHRARTAQILGAHVRLKSNPAAAEVGVPPKELLKITQKIDRVRHLHSFAGGFDSTGKKRSEGLQQVRAVLTTLIHGACLIHRVWQPENEIVPLSLELLPGVRISTPIDRQGDPKISYGIEYSDAHRTRVVAYHVRRVSKTMGDSFVPDTVWDRLPAEDCSLMELPEPAGMDRAMPLSVATVRMARNRGEMMEAVVSSARAQAQYYASIEVEEGTSPIDAAADDSDAETFPLQLQKIGEMQVLYNPKGRKTNWNNARLPDPDFTGFMDVGDSRMARGLSASKSRFTRQVSSSWAGGRMEEQQDDPIIEQYRSMVLVAWSQVHRWFLESCWLAGAVDMPGYATATAIYWNQFRAEFPGKVDINPQDTAGAIEKGYLTRTLTPQKAVERGGGDLRENLEQWADAYVMQHEIEQSRGLEPETLAFLVSGKSLSTASGDDLSAPTAPPEEDPKTGVDAGEAGNKKPKLKIAGGQ